MLKSMITCFTRATRKRRSRTTVPCPVVFLQLEPLEERTLLSSTLFLDFGAGIGMGGTMSTTADAFTAIFGANTGTNTTNGTTTNPTGLNGGSSLDFTPLFYDYDNDGNTNNADITALSNAVLAVVQDVLSPFDIDVVIAAATSLADAVASVGGGGDAYVFASTITSDFLGGGSVGTSYGLFGRAATADLSAQTGNNNDEAVQVYTDNLFNNTNGTLGSAAFNTSLVQRLAYTSTHEAFHTFSARHTPDESNSNPAASANQRLLASGDVIRRGSNTRSNPFIVTRYDIQRINTVTEPNNYLMVAGDGNMGLRDDNTNGVPDIAYSTGTGAHDIITFADEGGGVVDVIVNPNSNTARTTSISQENYDIDLATETDGDIRVDASINADEVIIDGAIAATFRASGGTGMDPGASEADLLTLSSAGLSGVYLPGPVGAGYVVYAGGATIDYTEFEDVEANGIPIDITSVSASDSNINEGDSINLSGAFVNIDTLDQHTVTINWGDGSDNTVLVLNAGVRDFGANHTYDDDNPTGTAADDYVVSVTITDEDDGSGFAANGATITVNNVDPSITSIIVSAASINEADSVTVSGTFTDPAIDFDTFSGSALWSDGVATAVTVDAGAGTFTTTRTFLDDHPATGTPSDDFTVDVTITDDDTGSDTATSPVVTVNNVDPVITEFASDATFEDKGEEGEPVNIAGAFTDIGTLDTHTAEVDWGDGSGLETVTVVQGAGAGTIEGSHVYVAGGIYTITVTLTDDDTGSDSTTTTAVITGVGVNEGVLWVIGTNDEDGDHAHVHQVGHDRIMVHADFIPEPSRTYLLADITENKMISYLCEGDDHLTISGRTTLTTIVHGGAGDDHLHAGSGVNALLGGEGDDKLNGKRGRDLLVGGEGEDNIVGSKGEDILVGGSLTDKSDDHIMDILNAWGDEGASYDKRVIDVGELLNVLNVIDDGVKDKLTGGADRDLFYAGVADMLRSAKPIEVVVIT